MDIFFTSRFYIFRNFLVRSHIPEKLEILYAEYHMNKTSFEEIKVVNCLILVILAEILSNKINPSGCINRYGSSPFI